MTFERLEALYHGHGSVHYKGELYEIVDVNESKQTAQIVEVGAMLQPAIEKKVEELE